MFGIGIDITAIKQVDTITATKTVAAEIIAVKQVDTITAVKQAPTNITVVD